jgi:hypothetical protein
MEGLPDLEEMGINELKPLKRITTNAKHILRGNSHP